MKYTCLIPPEALAREWRDVIDSTVVGGAGVIYYDLMTARLLSQLKLSPLLLWCPSLRPLSPSLP